MPQRLHPAPGVFFANVEDDTVVLDLNTDGYFCLVGLAGHLQIAPDRALRAAETDVLDFLIQSGLAATGDTGRGAGARRLPRPMRTSRSHQVPDPTLREFSEFLRSTAHAAVAFPKRRVSRLIGAEDDRPAPRPRCDADLVRRAVLFDRWLPWIPFQGQCLYRAYTLRRYLRLAGLDACWVFGVRTWPFAAHCWLQVEDLILDDDLDRVRLYTPILFA